MVLLPVRHLTVQITTPCLPNCPKETIPQFSIDFFCLGIKPNRCRFVGIHQSNGICQGGVLLPILFAIYLDDLLTGVALAVTGIFFVCAVGYADDVALLAPSPSALRIMLHFCVNFASIHGFQHNYVLCSRVGPHNDLST